MISILKQYKWQAVTALILTAIIVPQVAGAWVPGLSDIGLFLMLTAARITGWAGVLLNYAVDELVFNMGEKITTGFGLSIETSWSVIRDLMNLGFIFGLIYIGLQVILDAGTSHARRMLPPLIIAALLMNFSLFFTKVIVDFTNLAAAEIYQTVGFRDYSGGSTGMESAAINIGVSGAYMEIMGMKDLLSPNGQDGDELKGVLDAMCKEDTNCDITGLIYYFGATAFLLVAAYAFAMGAFMLISRFITLVLLMVFSPLMFAGMIFPKAQGYTSNWWKRFLNSAFFAPVYFLMLYIGWAIGSRAGVVDGSVIDGKGGDRFFSAAAGKYGSVDVILFFLIMIGFLIAAVQVGRKMSEAGSKGVMTAVDYGRRATIGAVAGSAAFAGRRSGGYAAQSYADSDFAKDSKFGRSLVGRQTLKGAKSVASSNFDMRTGAANLAGKFGGSGAKKAVERDLGTGSKKSYSKYIDDRNKQILKDTKDLGTRDVSKDEFDNYKSTAVANEVTAEKARIIAEQDRNINAVRERYKEDYAKLNDDRKEVEDLKAAPSLSPQMAVELAQKEAALKQKESNISEANKQIAVYERKKRNATSTAETAVEYSRQINRMNQLQRSSDFWSGRTLFGKAHVAAYPAAPTAAAKGLSVVGISAGSTPLMATAGAGAVGVTAARAQGYADQSAYRALLNEYGADGTKKKKASAEEKSLKKALQKFADKDANEDKKKEETNEDKE